MLSEVQRVQGSAPAGARETLELGRSPCCQGNRPDGLRSLLMRTFSLSCHAKTFGSVDCRPKMLYCVVTNRSLLAKQNTNPYIEGLRPIQPDTTFGFIVWRVAVLSAVMMFLVRFSSPEVIHKKSLDTGCKCIYRNDSRYSLDHSTGEIHLAYTHIPAGRDRRPLLELWNSNEPGLHPCGPPLPMGLVVQVPRLLIRHIGSDIHVWRMCFFRSLVPSFASVSVLWTENHEWLWGVGE